ncbi:tol-pal system protein YbgF [Marinobacteraceae bacterium S3BR75-40.1]
MRRFLIVMALAVSCSTAVAQSVPAFQSQDQARSKSSGSAELFFMIQQVQEEVRELRGLVEKQQHQLDRLSKQSKDRYIDLDQRLLELSKRVSALEGQGTSATGSPQDATGSAKPGGNADGVAPSEGAVTPDKKFRSPTLDERKAYAAIQDLIKQNKYDAAVDSIYDFLSRFEEGDLTVNAYYWLGEVYLVQDKLDQAKQAFTVVTARYPEHRKAPDAAFKLGVAMERQGNEAEAKRQYQDVVSQYPNSNAASLAKERLGSS